MTHGRTGVKSSHLTHGRACAQTVPGVMTAGDLIRAELDSGESQLGLAKRLAGTTSDADPEVRRWRYVVMRAAKGAEPQEGNLPRIAEILGGNTGDLRRGRVERKDHLAILEAGVAEMLKGQKEALAGQLEIRELLSDLREMLDGLQSAPRAARRRRSS